MSTEKSEPSAECIPPDSFIYSIPDYPLHIKPWIPNEPFTSTQTGMTLKDKEDRHQQKRTRDFFKYARSSPYPIKHDNIMSNGESVGAASLWYIHHHYGRRVKNGLQNRDNKRTKPVKSERTIHVVEEEAK